MSALRFDGRTAIVTGAGGNPSLGRAHALLLASRGANVVVNDIGVLPAALGYPGVASAENVAEEIRALGGNAVADIHSVATEAGGAAMVQTALDAFGSIDILVNNAGICRVVAFDDMTPADFRETIEINLMGTVHTCRAAWPHMKAQGYGRIVNISSGSMTGLAWQTAYAASKAGILALTRCAAIEAAPQNIRINAVVPSLALHPYLEKVTDPAHLQNLIRTNEAFGRAAEPWEVGNAIVFLASDYASYMTGEALSVSCRRA